MKARMPFAEWLAHQAVVYAPPEGVCYRGGRIRRCCRYAVNAVWWEQGDPWG